jgi:hypothetical protein
MATCPAAGAFGERHRLVRPLSDSTSWDRSAAWLNRHDSPEPSRPHFRPPDHDYRLPEWALSPLLVFLFTLATFLLGAGSTLWLAR